MSSAPIDLCLCLCVVFAVGLAVTITLSYFSIQEYDNANKDGHGSTMLTVWYIISLIASVALGTLMLATLYHIGKALYEKIYADAVARVEARLQEGQAHLPVNE